MTPSDRMVAAHRAPRVRRLIDCGQHVHSPAGVASEAIPLIRPLPACGKRSHRRVTRILDPDNRRLDGRVTLEVRANQLPIPGPAVLGITRRVNASKATTGPDIAFEGCLLTVIEDVARCQEEDHCPVAGQVGIRERAGIFGGIDQIPVLGSQLVDGGYSGRYGGMPVGLGPGKDKDADWWWGG